MESALRVRAYPVKLAGSPESAQPPLAVVALFQ
jgi:hypothetical protein